MKSTANSFAVPAQAGTRFQMSIGALVAPLDSGVRRNGEATLPIGRFRKAVAWLTLISFLGQTTVSIAGGIVADPSAPASQRPTVLNAANGVPQVNIQTPSAAGVSRNTYSQFDVQQQGAILNNARTNTQTQLGGWIQGNPSLATGTARIILNEVNSSNPSLLQGHIEVAGDRAQVIIANPAGVTCDGCGFINANRATLTTGTPIMNGGSLDGYLVQRGQVTVQGAGLDAGQTDYTDIIARSVQVNAGIWANDLKVTAGANRINTDHTQITPIAGSGDAPAFAVDVAQLGGMYAGKIHLIGTEAGVGVRNAGNIGASAGEVIVTVDGRLENAGSLTAATNVGINAGSVANSGTIYAQGDASLAVSGDIANSGTIAAQGNVALAASGANSRIDSTMSSVLGAGVRADGTLAASGNLTLSATQSIAANGQNLSAGDQSMTARIIDLADSQTSGRNLSLRADAGDLDASRAVIDANGILTVQAAQTLRTDSATVSAGQLDLSANDLSNIGGELVQTGSGDIDINLSGTLDNTQGRIAANSTNLSLTTNTLTNTDGIIEHAGTGALALNATTINGTRGSIAGNGSLALVAQSATLDAGSMVARQIAIDTAILSNRGGEIIQTGTGASSITAATQLDNTGGKVASNGNVTLTASGLINQGGTVQTTADLAMAVAGVLDNTAAGVIAAGGSADVVAEGVLNASGSITAGQTLNIAATQVIDNAGGTMAAHRDVAMTAASIVNTQGIIGSVQGGVTATATSGAIDNTAGRIEAAQDIALASDGLTNTDGAVNGNNVSLDSHAQLLDNTRGTIAAQGTLTIQSGRLTNDAGLIQAVDAATIDTYGQALDNTNSGTTGGTTGGIVGQSTVTLTTGDLNNRAGFIGAKGNLTANSAAIVNTQGGVLTGESALTLIGTSLDNRGGQVQALGDLTVDTGSGAVDNTASLMRSGSTLAITAGSVVNANTQGADQGIEGQHVAIAANQIGNTTGAIRADDTLALTGHGTLDNTQGLISSSNVVSIADSNLAAKALAVANTGGTIIAGTNLAIDSASLSGDGKVLSQGNLSAKLVSDYTHSGEFQADGNATLETAGTLINRATLAAGNTLSLTAATIDNQAAGEIVANKLNLSATDSHTLINRGLIDGQDTFIDTITLNNLGTGRIYGDHVAIAATTLNNDAETVNGVTRAAVIAARDRLDIGATSITNREGALLFSAGDLAIAGALDANHQATGQADTLTNRNATIEALGSVSIAAASIQNLNAGVTVTQETESPVGYDQFTPRGTSVVLNSADYPGAQIGNFNMKWRSAGPYTFREYWRYVYSGTTTRDTVSSSLPGNILSGDAMTLIGNVTNSDSKIIAGGALNMTGGSLQNINTEGRAVSSYSGTQYYYDYDGDESCSDPGDGCYDISASAYNPANSVSTFSLPTTRVEQQTAPTGSGTVIAALATSGITQTAAGASDASVAVVNPQPVAVITQIAAVTDGAASGANTVIHTVTPNTVLPTNSLFNATPNPSANYLVETDPRFAGYRNWLSSDYMLQQMNVDPTLTQKRIGDGFYEQKLVREQVAQLTGRRFLDGYANDEAQYQALMTAGITVAQQWHLIPGIALSDAQVAQLTSDIVWLVEKSVTQADGSTVKVLVPQVYVRLQEGDLATSGALLAGDTVNLTLTGDLTNAGTIAGRTVVSLAADNIKNLGGRIAGRDVSLTALADLANLGGTLQGGDRLSLSAGRDFTVASTTQSSANRAGLGSFSRTNLDRVAGLYVTNANGTLVADAGRDLTLTAAVIVNDGSQGQTLLAAGRDLTLDTVTRAEQNNSVRNAKNYQKRTTTADLGTTIQTQGDVTLVAGNDLRAKAANVTSEQGIVTAIAGHDLALTAGRQTSAVEQARHTQKSGTFSSKRTTTRDTYDDDTAIGSTFSGDAVTLQAGHDLTVQGSNVVGTHDVSLNAGNDITLAAAAQTHDETHARKTSKSGIFSSGASITLGSQKLATTNDTQQVTNLASTVGSLEGNVSIEAGKAYTQTGSNVLALNGDIDIAAQKVDINAATDTYANQQTTKFKQSGISVSISNPVISAVQTTQQMAQAASQTSDPRMQALAAATTALAVKNAADAVASNPEQAGGINLNISLGTSKSSSKSSQTATTAVGSQVAAGGDVNIMATGAAQDSDLNVIGSQISAGHDVTLIADDQVNLLAAQNTNTLQAKNKSSSASIGVSIGTNGFAVTASASKGKGKANGTDVTYTNAEVDAGNTLTLVSGSDTNLKGATAAGKQVIADVGRNLNIESLQNTSSYRAEQSSAGFSVSVPIGAGMAGGSVSASKSKVESDYASVVEQSGIKAGDNGFQIAVNGNTGLTGAVIASTQSAIDNNRNRLTTETLTTSDIKNKAEYQANAMSATVGVGTQGGMPSLSGAGVGSDSDKASSTTVSAISQGTVSITDSTAQQSLSGNDAVATVALLNRDVKVNENGETVDKQGNSTAHTITPIFDKQKVEREIQAQVQITQAFSQQAPQALSTFALDKTKPYQDAKDYEQIKNQQENNIQLSDYEISRLAELESAGMTTEKAQTALSDPQTKSNYENWNANGNYRIASNIIIAAIGGGISSATAAVTKESLSWAADQMRQAMIEDSKKFPGICVSENDCISNMSGKSVGVNGDNIKVAGGRVVLTDWCDEGRCEKDPSTRSGYKENPDGTIIFKPVDSSGKQLTINEFIDKYADKYELRSPLGGAQGGEGQMKILGFQFDYAAGSFWDKLAEAYAGTHDTLNSVIWYDEFGNGKSLDGTFIGKIGSIANISNVGVATPFALSVLLPPEVWNAVFSAIKAR